VVIETLELTDFRNFASRKLVFSSPNTFLIGPNGTGKTNVLESIGFLSLLRSFRGASPREMIAAGAKGFQLAAAIRTRRGGERLTVRESVSGKRELFIDRTPVRRSSEFIREFHAVAFVPEDREIGSGTSGCRRRFFDILISSVEPEYLLRLSRYNRALLQRNRALKSAPATAAAFDGELAEQAPFIAQRRAAFSEAVAVEVNRMLGDGGSFAIHYRSDVPETPEQFLSLLASRRATEMRRQCTCAGCQLDEFELYYLGRPLRGFGSTGQVRLVTLLMKLAQFKLIRRHSQSPVVVLADDVTGELDPVNLDRFLSTIADADQALFTFADPPRFTLPESSVIDF